ncbi:type II toxin-antitoxin system Phd/YefM family antitoxin [Burkholderia sp. Bp8963]|uniref:type II toxin-antitoxin system Phd/YefM family antitoxin n=1 Tax=Burkholderia sp. Bp8963 TaxID=2184547 RepID=UPI000F5A92AB|nr:type II toxin-antitoxin system Phd/YefM family antitoxin [Burkholderia sp. Bp8963]RQS56678.1 type II toxin-antitoxin system Phd/YefM family antitoxin [Burkholderia sp. Bp8963]
MPTISATELARHTREILDQIVRGGEPVIVERNQIPVARLVPPEPIMTAVEALDGLPTDLTAEHGDRWLRNSREGFSDEVRDSWA